MAFATLIVASVLSLLTLLQGAARYRADGVGMTGALLYALGSLWSFGRPYWAAAVFALTDVGALDRVGR